jgi:type IV secretion system protein VirD4
MTDHPDTSVPTTDHESDRTRALPWSTPALPVGLRRLATALGVTWPEGHHVRPRGWPATFNGAYLGWGATGPIFTGPEHAALIIGPPRSGKTSSVVIPAVALWPGPAVVTSTKPDVLRITSPLRSRMGRVWHWDPTGTTDSPAGATRLRWSPVPGCADWDTAVQRAWALATTARTGPLGDSAHWVERAQALLAPLLHAAAVADIDLTGVLTWLHTRNILEPLGILDSPRFTVAHQLLQGIAATETREQSGIWSTADSLLAAYRTHATLSAAEAPNFEPRRFVTSADTIYITAPADSQAQHAPLICCLLDQIRRAVTERPHPEPRMLWALDEVANIAPLPTLPSVVADGGGQGLVVLAALQDLSQARTRWGGAADGFLTLFPTTVLLPGVADPGTLKTISTIAGQVDRPQVTTTRGWRASSRSTTTRKEPLLAEHEIAQGRPGHALIIQSARPARLLLTPWHTTPWLTERLNGDHR